MLGLDTFTKSIPKTKGAGSPHLKFELSIIQGVQLNMERVAIL